MMAGRGESVRKHGKLSEISLHSSPLETDVKLHHLTLSISWKKEQRQHSGGNSRRIMEMMKKLFLMFTCCYLWNVLNCALDSLSPFYATLDLPKKWRFRSSRERKEERMKLIHLTRGWEPSEKSIRKRIFHRFAYFSLPLGSDFPTPKSFSTFLDNVLFFSWFPYFAAFT